MEIINLALRGLEFFWTLLVLALTGNFIALAKSGNTSIINYDMFIAVFTMLCLIFLIFTSIKGPMGPALISSGLDGLLALIWLIGGIAMAGYLHVHSCSNQHYIHTNVVIKNGGKSEGQRCREAQAITAFLWFGFATFTASAVLSFMSGSGSGGFRMRK